MTADHGEEFQEHARLRELLDGWQAGVPPPPRAMGDGTVHQRLRALGYID